MKIAFVLSRGIHYFYYDRVVRLLHAWGHEVRIVSSADFSDEGNKSSRALKKLLIDESGIVLEDALPRKNYIYLCELIRGLRDYANFIRPEHPTPHLAVNWVRKELSPKVLNLIQKPLIMQIIATKSARAFLSFLESLILPEEQIVKWLKDFQPQIVFASPYVFTGEIEIEYTKAAQSLNIPVIASLLSWDNLTSKGTYKIRPDWLFVWNQNLKDEAIQIHDFEKEHVVIAGAPVYDPWFELTPSLDRASICLQAGINPEKPYILYLCSSRGISDNEIGLIRELTACLGKMEPAERPSVIIRPHPFNPVEPGEVENDWVKVFPKGGQRPDSDETRQLYYDSLHHSAVVFGINTTGFLEAALVDKPCVTLVNPLTNYGQEQRAHFRHLTEADFIEIAKDFEGLADCIAGIIKGEDAKKANRRNFVHQFLRPQGMNIPASRVVAGAILAVGRGEKPENWDMRNSPEEILASSLVP